MGSNYSTPSQSPYITSSNTNNSNYNNNFNNNYSTFNNNNNSVYRGKELAVGIAALLQLFRRLKIHLLSPRLALKSFYNA